jgi:hypothetical protein
VQPVPSVQHEKESLYRCWIIYTCIDVDDCSKRYGHIARVCLYKGSPKRRSDSWPSDQQYKLWQLCINLKAKCMILIYTNLNIYNTMYIFANLFHVQFSGGITSINFFAEQIRLQWKFHNLKYIFFTSTISGEWGLKALDGDIWTWLTEPKEEYK